MSMNNPFHWRENPRPSIFARDPKFCPTVTGLTRNENSSRGATERIEEVTRRTGVNPGTIVGISERADKMLREL